MTYATLSPDLLRQANYAAAYRYFLHRYGLTRHGARVARHEAKLATNYGNRAFVAPGTVVARIPAK